MSSDTPILPEDPAVLKAMITALQAENARMAATIRAHDLLIQTLQMRIAKLKKQAFGKSSEKIEREIEQLELALEDLLIASAESATTSADEDEADAALEVTTDDIDVAKPRRRPRVSATTPRERRELDPGSCCPDCGGDLRLVGEDMSEMLDLVAAQLKVLQIARLKKSCRRCEKMVQTPAPSRPIPGSMASAALLAWILVSKFDDHLPLYRLNEIFARMGADIPDSTLVDWCGRAMKVLAPLVERIEADVMASDLLHADDTPIRVLDRSLKDRGLGKGVKQGRIWAYVRDPRPWTGTAPPGAVYRFAPDWKQEHVQGHLAQTRGILQADGYKGYPIVASDQFAYPDSGKTLAFVHEGGRIVNDFAHEADKPFRIFLQQVDGAWRVRPGFSADMNDIMYGIDAVDTKGTGPGLACYTPEARDRCAVLEFSPAEGGHVLSRAYGVVEMERTGAPKEVFDAFVAESGVVFEGFSAPVGYDAQTLRLGAPAQFPQPGGVPAYAAGAGVRREGAPVYDPLGNTSGVNAINREIALFAVDGAETRIPLLFVLQ